MDDGYQLIESKLEELRPTQVTVGFDEVGFKRRQWRARTNEEKTRLIFQHPFPVVRGPNANFYMIDGHHLGYALLEEGVDMAWVRLVDDLSHLETGGFWRVMDERKLIYPYDAQGQRRDFKTMPRTLRELGDDPFRSLVARMRRSSKCPKNLAPFAEFQWADYLRNRMDLETLRAYPEQAVKTARKLVRGGLCSPASSQCRCIGS